MRGVKSHMVSVGQQCHFYTWKEMLIFLTCFSYIIAIDPRVSPCLMASGNFIDGMIMLTFKCDISIVADIDLQYIYIV